MLCLLDALEKVFQMPRDCELDMGKSGWGWEVREDTKNKLLTACKVPRGKELWDGGQAFPHSEVDRIMK